MPCQWIRILNENILAKICPHPIYAQCNPIHTIHWIVLHITCHMKASQSVRLQVTFGQSNSFSIWIILSTKASTAMAPKSQPHSKFLICCASSNYSCVHACPWSPERRAAYVCTNTLPYTIYMYTHFGILIYYTYSVKCSTATQHRTNMSTKPCIEDRQNDDLRAKDKRDTRDRDTNMLWTPRVNHIHVIRPHVARLCVSIQLGLWCSSKADHVCVYIARDVTDTAQLKKAITSRPSLFAHNWCHKAIMRAFWMIASHFENCWSGWEDWIK